MSATVRVVTAREAEALVPVLADVLADCVAGGASVSFMAPYSRADAADFWQAVAGAVARGTVSLLVAEVDGAVRGTVQVAYDLPPNQPHRGEVRKLLVHRGARGRGLAALLGAAAEAAEEGDEGEAGGGGRRAGASARRSASRRVRSPVRG